MIPLSPRSAMHRSRLSFLVLCSLAACDVSPFGQSGKPDVVGVVRAVESRQIANTSVPTIMLEVREVRSSARVLKGCAGVSQFHLSESTRISRASGGAAAEGDIEAGRKVSIWVVPDAPITLSCTPGAAAARVRLE